jgi:hypothetical protein
VSRRKVTGDRLAPCKAIRWTAKPFGRLASLLTNSADPTLSFYVPLRKATLHRQDRNFLVNRRMNKAQQMRWSRRGADLLLQVRCAVYNGAFGSGFGNTFETTSNTVQKSPLAA